MAGFVFMKNYFLLSLFFVLQSVSCQDYGKLTYIDSLPESLEEISGMETVNGSDLLLAVNDSGNNAVVYIYDRAVGLYTLESALMDNVDWEDLSVYEDKQTGRTLLYIGDIGNNKNKRKDLIIYELDITNLSGQDEVINEVRAFPFEYDTQEDFPPKNKNQLFDCEAFIRVDDYFFLFSKNRSKDFNGKTQVYRLKVNGSSKEAEFLTNIEICNDSDDCLITSADVNSKGDIALLTSDKVFILSDYDREFKDFNIKRYDLEHYSQKESVVFKEDDLLWISDEQTKNTGGNLYSFKIEN